MAENVKLKDLYADEKVYDGINTVEIPKADGTGNAKFIVPPSQKFMLRESDYQEDYVQGSRTTIAVSEDDGSGGFVLVSIANAMMHMSEPKIISVATFSKDTEGFLAYHSMEEQTITEFMTRIFQSEAEKSVVVTPDTYVVKKGWTNIISTVTTEGNIVRVTIEKFEQITDPSTFTFDASLPWYINEGKENYFYSYIAEATQQMKSVSVTENGTQIINPDSGKSGLTAVQLSVDVAGGGGTGVQPDYAQNNSTAADYITNRPGGYMVEHPAISKTIAASDYVSMTSGLLYKFSDVVLSDEAILGGTGKIKTISNGVETETDISEIAYMGSMGGAKQFVVTNSSGLQFGILCGGISAISLESATWFSANADDDTGAITAYISEFTTAAYSTTVEIPEKFTEVKPANWGAASGYAGYIAGRPGGYFFTYEELFRLMSHGYTYTWDGVVGDKETITLQYGEEHITYVKVSADTPNILAFAGGQIGFVSSGQTTTQNIKRDFIDIGSLGAVGIYTERNEGKSGAPMAILSFGNPSFDTNITGDTLIPQGVWFAYEVTASGVTTYCAEISASSDITKTFHAAMPYELVEQNPSTLTTDNQTLTDAQKLQARTNIGTVEGTDKEMILSSSTAGSAKKFKITVTDDGTLTATEVTQ